jgi:hypothetical protein
MGISFCDAWFKAPTLPPHFSAVLVGLPLRILHSRFE